MTAKPGLLDVNVLVALIDPAHRFHASAHAWFKAHRSRGWATCPLSENGCLRIMSNPGYPFPGLTAERVRGILTELIRVEGHRFWLDSVSFLQPKRFNLDKIGYKHLTDLYLLGVAVSNDGCLVTFDRNIPCHALTGFRPEDIEILTEEA
jgi:toxin-antitoxin system PIN domain toxin